MPCPLEQLEAGVAEAVPLREMAFNYAQTFLSDIQLHEIELIPELSKGFPFRKAPLGKTPLRTVEIWNAIDHFVKGNPSFANQLKENLQFFIGRLIKERAQETVDKKGIQKNLKNLISSGVLDKKALYQILLELFIPLAQQFNTTQTVSELFYPLCRFAREVGDEEELRRDLQSLFSDSLDLLVQKSNLIAEDPVTPFCCEYLLKFINRDYQPQIKCIIKFPKEDRNLTAYELSSLIFNSAYFKAFTSFFNSSHNTENPLKLEWDELTQKDLEMFLKWSHPFDVIPPKVKTLAEWIDLLKKSSKISFSPKEIFYLIGSYLPESDQELIDFIQIQEMEEFRDPHYQKEWVKVRDKTIRTAFLNSPNPKELLGYIFSVTNRYVKQEDLWMHIQDFLYHPDVYPLEMLYPLQHLKSLAIVQPFGREFPLPQLDRFPSLQTLKINFSSLNKLTVSKSIIELHLTMSPLLKCDELKTLFPNLKKVFFFLIPGQNINREAFPSLEVGESYDWDEISASGKVDKPLSAALSFGDESEIPLG